MENPNEKTNNKEKPKADSLKIKEVTKENPNNQPMKKCDPGVAKEFPLNLGSTGDIYKIPQGKEEGTELAAVIITIQRGSSYDDLFAKVKQKAATGTHVHVYRASNCTTTELKAALFETGGGETGANLRADIAAVDPASVVVNWECCSGCDSSNYEDGNETVALMAALLAKGFMVMVSDFSLGMLIDNWDSAMLGANPFLLVGQFGTEMTLRFEPTVLATCEDSAQLQMLGELCAGGEARIHAMGNTKAFTVSSAVTAADHPEGVEGWSELQVLTTVTTADGRDASTFTQGKRKQNLCTVGDHHGIAGHVVLRYASGGRLLASCPHWIELSKLDVNAENLLAVAEKRYGTEYANKMREEISRFGDDTAAVKNYSSAQSCTFVQQSVPASYSMRKKK